MKLGLSAATIGLSLLMTQVTQRGRDQSLRHRRRARAPIETLAPQFEQAPGTSWSPTFDLPPTADEEDRRRRALRRHHPVLRRRALIKQGKVVADSRTVFGRVGVGVAVRQGAPKPDFSTVEAFKRSLLNAKLDRNLRRGQQRALRRLAARPARHRRTGQAEDPVGRRRRRPAQMVSRGEVDFVVSGLPPLIGTPGIEWLGYLPEEINELAACSAAASASTPRKPERPGARLLQVPQRRRPRWRCSRRTAWSRRSDAAVTAARTPPGSTSPACPARSAPR